MMRVAIIGAGALGQQCAHMIDNYSKDQVVGFFDDEYIGDNPEQVLLGRIDEIENHKSLFDSLLIGIGYKHLAFKVNLATQLESKGLSFYTFIHPSAIIDKSALVGEGVIIYPGTVIDMQVQIQNHVLINNGCIISHDSQIGQSSFLAPRVTISGNCNIGAMNFLGTSTTFCDDIQTADEVHTGAGAVVISNLQEKGLYIGIPAKIKTNG